MSYFKPQNPVSARFLRRRSSLWLVLLCGWLLGAGCSSPKQGSFSFSADETAFIDELQHRTFNFFWEQCDPVTGLTPDRAPTESFASISATGFAADASDRSSGWSAVL